MSSILPTIFAHLPTCIQSQLTASQNNKVVRFGLTFFSKEGPLGKFGPVLATIFGKPIFVTLGCLMTYYLIGRFSSPPVSTILKVIIVVATIGFIAYHFISLYIVVERESREQRKQAEELAKIVPEWDQSIQSGIDDNQLFSEALKPYITELQNRKQLVDDWVQAHPILTIGGEELTSIAKAQIEDVEIFNKQVTKLQQDFVEISQAIQHETATIQPTDYKDLPLVIQEQNEQRTQTQVATEQRMSILKQILAQYDEFCTKVGIIPK
jgi:hypothetical protein